MTKKEWIQALLEGEEMTSDYAEGIKFAEKGWYKSDKFIEVGGLI